ncbi:acyltransferase family protein [Ottowia sp.]|uniref:acyltransferase family protein n=1 Tax=Ottowia sp. TaxID=1898956 RepID=UPI002B833A93|nr:acyltransferase family protein [Ottowia sp.]
MNQFVTGRPAASAAATEPWIDWGKALASQLIVWHHLVHYGPLAPRLSAFAPGLLAWLNDRALYAVQVFLVIGGYLAARSLWPQPGCPRVGPADWAPRVAQRWRRLMPLYAAALVLAVVCAAAARALMQDNDTPGAPTLAQLLAHALMLQDLLSQPALSAGVWYVAIDLQLYALLAGLAALLAWVQAHAAPAASPSEPRWGGLGALALVALALASIGVFNLRAELEVSALYFFCSYALGVLAAWGRGAASDAARERWGLLIVLLAACGLLLAWRDRLALAALCAALLLWQPERGAPRAGAWAAAGRIATALAALSYALFLVHYPVSLLVTGATVHWLPVGAGYATAALVLTWALSLALAWALTQALAPGVLARRVWQPGVAWARAGHWGH